MVVMFNQRLTGVRSSGLPFLFWMVMSFYGALKLRTLVLVAEDAVRASCTLHMYMHSASPENLTNHRPEIESGGFWQLADCSQVPITCVQNHCHFISF